MLDKMLLSEHNLRDHVSIIRKRIEAYMETVITNQYGRDVTIRYEAEDGGRWTISHYHSKTTTSASGAELDLVATAFCTAVSANHGNKSLRALIAGPAPTNDETI